MPTYLTLYIPILPLIQENLVIRSSTCEQSAIRGVLDAEDEIPMRISYLFVVFVWYACVEGECSIVGSCYSSEWAGGADRDGVDWLVEGRAI